MRQDVKHKIAEQGKLGKGCKFPRKDKNFDIIMSPHREAMKRRHIMWWDQKCSTIDYDFLYGLIKGQVGNNYDRFISDFRRVCAKQRRIDQQALDFIRDKFTMNTFVVDGKRMGVFDNGWTHELYHGELFVDEDRIIHRYHDEEHKSLAYRVNSRIQAKIAVQFIEDGMWFKKTNGIWYFSKVVPQVTIEVRRYVRTTITPNMTWEWRLVQYKKYDSCCFSNSYESAYVYNKAGTKQFRVGIQNVGDLVALRPYTCSRGLLKKYGLANDI